MKKHLLKSLLVGALTLAATGAWAQTWTFASNTAVWGADGITLNGGAHYDENATAVTSGGVTFTGTSGFVSTAKGIGFYATGSTTDENISVVVPAGWKATVTAYTSGNRTVKGEMGETIVTYNAAWASSTKEFVNNGTADQTLYLYCNQNPGGTDQSKAPFLEKIVLTDMSTVKSFPWTANAVATIGGTKTVIKTYSSGESTVDEDSQFAVTVDKAILYEDAYYVLNDEQFGENVYGKTFTMGSEEPAYEFNYELIENVVFYGEVEDIYDSGDHANKQAGISVLSNGGGYTGQGTAGYVTLKFTVPEVAVYKLVLGMNNTNDKSRGFNYSIDGADVSETITVNAGSAFVQEIAGQTLTAGEHTITLNITYSLTPIFDYLLVIKTAADPAAAALAAAKQALQQAIDQVKAYDIAALADAIAAAQAAVDAPEATIESLTTAGATFETTVKNYLKEMLTQAIAMAESLNAEALATYVAEAKTALANEDATVEDLAGAMFALTNSAKPYVRASLEQAVEMATMLNEYSKKLAGAGVLDTPIADAQAVLAKEDATAQELAAALQSLTTAAQPVVMLAIGQAVPKAEELVKYVGVLGIEVGEDMTNAIAAAKAITNESSIQEAANALTALMDAAAAPAKAALAKAIALAAQIDPDEALTTALTAARTLAASDDANLLEVAEALKGLMDAALAPAKAMLQKAIALAKMLGSETLNTIIAQAEALAAKEDATITDLADTLQTLAEDAMPEAQKLVETAREYMATFAGDAAEELKEDFDKLVADIEAKNITAIKDDIETLMTKGMPYVEEAIKKIESYAEDIADETLNADIEDIKAAVDSKDFAGIFSATKQFETHFVTAANAFVESVEFNAALEYDEGKTKGYDELQTAITAAKSALAGENASIVSIGLAIRNLILAVKAYDKANEEALVVAPETATKEDWTLEGNYKTAWGGAQAQYATQVAFDGTDVYINGLAYDFKTQDAWAKGTLSDGKVIVPAGQLINVPKEGEKYYLLGSDDMETVTDIVFAYDAEAQTLTAETKYILCNYNVKDAVNEEYLSWYENVKLHAGAPVVEEPVTAPEELATETWNVKSTIYYDETDFEGYATEVQVGFDGDDAYILGIDWNAAALWIKATKNAEGKYVVPALQYMGEVGFWAKTKYYFTALDEEGNPVDAVFSYDEKTQTFTTGQTLATVKNKYDLTASITLKGTTIISNPNAVVEDNSYEFVASEWIAGDAGRISPDNVTVDAEANTITVSQTGQNNVALLFRSSNVYEVTAAERYFVIKATGLSTDAGASYLWWLNNTNNGSQIEPTDIYEEDGQTVFAWDCATIAIGGQLGLSDTEFKDEGGWSTTFGMTLADQEVPAVISYIGFQEEIQNPVEEHEYEFVASEWPAGDPGRISPDNVHVDEADNTITVDAQGDNNVALNFKTDKVYYISEPVKYFVIQATGLSTEEGKSYLWWLNAKNNGGQVAPTDVFTDEGGLTTFVWDITADATFASGFSTEGKSYLDGTGAGTWGWTTTFGLTLADSEVPAVITHIGYEPENSPIATGINSVKSTVKAGDAVYNLNGVRVNNVKKGGLYIINGKKQVIR